MLFNTQIFLFVFLPIVLLGYYCLHKASLHNSAKILLFFSSLIFYGYYNPAYLILLLGSIAGNYILYKIMQMLLPDSVKIGWLRKGIVIAGVAANLFVLFYFKYFNFFIHNVNKVFRTDFNLRNIILPLGISFFTFQQISFLVDCYKGETGKYSLLDYGVFVAFFPQLVAGPIVLHKDMIPQLSEKSRWKPDMERFESGLKYFVIGLFKKTMVADRFGQVVSLGYAGAMRWSVWETILIILSYTLQIYFDFSGYSDMAIGLGKLFGIEIPVNFDSPYKASSIADFWKRWHMTMTQFFTKYVYIPLGGSRKGIIRTCLNTMIVFALSGLWHGAAWTFVLWGILHGAALVFHRLLHVCVDKLPKALTGFVTFLFVNIAWVLFRAEGTYQAVRIFKSLLTGGFAVQNMDLCYAFLGDNLKFMLENISWGTPLFDGIALAVTIIGTIAALLVVFAAPSSHRIANSRKHYRGEGVVWGFAAVLCIMTFTKVSTFLYFNF